MANPEHVAILKQGVEIWNKWRDDNPDIKPDLCKADLRKADLKGVNFNKTDLSQTDLSEAKIDGAFLYTLFDKKAKEIIIDKQASDLIVHDRFGGFMEEGGIFRYVRIADLSGANLYEAKLIGTNLRMANLSGANLYKAILVGANLENVNLSKAILNDARLNKVNLSRATLKNAKLKKADLLETNLFSSDLSYAELQRARLNGANLFATNLTGADLTGAVLNHATFVKTNLQGTNLSNCLVYGISAWDLLTDKETKQLNMKINNYREPEITVDNLEVAQFIYLLLNNDKIGEAIETIGRKGVLIIGRFTEKRKAILHSIRDELRSRYNLLPIMFEFDPLRQDPTIKTLSTLAHLSRFVIADLTDAKSILQELTTILKDLPTLPVKPIIHESDDLPPMGDSFLIMQSMLKPYIYGTQAKLLDDLKREVIDPAEECIKTFEAQLADIRRQWFPWQQK